MIRAKDLAKYLCKTNEEMIYMLNKIGIYIENADKPLTNEELIVLKNFIDKRKEKGSTEKINKEREDFIIVNNEKYQLLEKIGDGGEGIIYRIGEKYLCKIYKNVTSEKIEKLRLMLSMRLKFKGICSPLDLACNSKNEPIGYVMEMARGIELQRALANRRQVEERFLGFKKREMVQLSITILEKIEYLHRKKIILGDINPRNILIYSPTEVYFVDTDSYQIENFPCTVGTTTYTAPEIQGKNFNEFLRTFGNEYFSIATLLFTLMIPGKAPYSKKGGEDVQENILNMEFAYALKDEEGYNIPTGPWKYCWSHLPLFIKKDFYKSFKRGEEFSEKNSRLDPSIWKEHMGEYLRLIENGEIGKRDRMSLEIFPDRFIKDGKEFEREEESKYRLIFRKLLNI